MTPWHHDALCTASSASGHKHVLTSRALHDALHLSITLSLWHRSMWSSQSLSVSSWSTSACWSPTLLREIASWSREGWWCQPLGALCWPLWQVGRRWSDEENCLSVCFCNSVCGRLCLHPSHHHAWHYCLLCNVYCLLSVNSFVTSTVLLLFYCGCAVTIHCRRNIV